MAAINHSGSEEGPLSRYLERSTPEFIDAQEIELAFRIDRRFPAASNLVSALLNLLQDEDLDDGGSTRRERWLNTLTLIKPKGAAAGWNSLAPTGRGGNPLGNQLKKYAVPALFLQPISDAVLRSRAW